MALPVSLQPQPSKVEQQDALPDLVRRIKDERGHLRNITELGLQDEIQRQDAGDSDKVGNDEDTETGPKDLETRQKELLEARDAMMLNVSAAHNQVMIALDLVSFLLKKDAPRQAELTMSPLLKADFPQGTLGFDKLPASEPGPDQVVESGLTASGWSMKSLDQAANSLLEVANNLEGEVGRETRYWEDVLSVRAKKWSLCRVPRQKTMIGVRYGFSEADPTFSGHSLAALRPDEDGKAVLEKPLVKEPRAIRVQIVERERIIAVSQVVTPLSNSDDIEGRIHQARDSLFEAELFHELGKEARALLAYGVKRVDSAIFVPFSMTQGPQQGAGQSPERHALISLKPTSAARLPTSGVEDDDTLAKAQTIALSLRILLTNMYRQRLRRRSKPPPPLSSDGRGSETYPMLRTVLGYLQHTSSVSKVGTAVHHCHQILKNARIPTTSRQLTEQKADDDQLSRNETPMESLTSTLSGPWTTIHALKVSSTKITITTMTGLSEPTYGTTYRITTSIIANNEYPEAYNSSVKDGLSFPTFVAHGLRSAMDHVYLQARLAISKHIQSLAIGWTRHASGTSDERIELRRTSETDRSSKRLFVLFNQKRLVFATREEDEQMTVLGAWGRQIGDAEDLSFEDVLKNVGE